MPLSLHLLPERGDVDTSDDLIRHHSTSLLKWLEPRISVIIPTLNEAPQIGEAMARVGQCGVESIVARRWG